MVPYTITYFGNTQKKESDICILMPHNGDNPEWMRFIRDSFKNTHDISDDLLLRYMLHEADRGAREVMHAAIETFLAQEANQLFRITVLEVHVPRWFCDLNRPWEKACPPVVDASCWRVLYDDTMAGIHSSIQNVQWCFHLHTMCSREPIYRWSFDTSVKSVELERFLDTGYTGEPRECNILTETTDGIKVTADTFDDIIREAFTFSGIPLIENKAYKLVPEYPSTNIAEEIPTSIVELTKWLLATEETMNAIDSSQIVFSPEKIAFFWRILSEIFSRACLVSSMNEKK